MMWIWIVVFEFNIIPDDEIAARKPLVIVLYPDITAEEGDTNKNRKINYPQVS